MTSQHLPAANAPEPARARLAAQILVRDLVDDAGLFPPTALTMPAAVARHMSDLSDAHGVLTHRFLCPASRLDELRIAVDRQLSAPPAGATTAQESGRPTEPLRIGLIADRGAGSIDQAATVSADARFRLTAVEFPLGAAGAADQGAALAAARDAMDRAALPASVPLFVEADRVGRSAELAARLAESARGADPNWPPRPVGVKIRCGGVRPDLFPTPEDLAAAIWAVARHDTMMKATAGLHHAVRYTDPDTGFTHHGFLNVLIAVAQAVRGAAPADLTATLRSTDTVWLVEQARALDAEHAELTRRVFTGYGSCSTRTPVDELTTLGLWSNA